MRFRINSDTLGQALKLVKPGLISTAGADRPCVRVLAQSDRITLSTGSRQGHFQVFMTGKVEEEGDLIVPYQQLLETVKPLHAMLLLKSQENSLLITSEGMPRHQAFIEEGKTMEQFDISVAVPGSTFQRKDHSIFTCQACKQSSVQKELQTYKILENPSQHAQVSKKRLVQMFDQVAWMIREWPSCEQPWQRGMGIELAHDVLSLVGMYYRNSARASEPVTGTWKGPLLVDAVMLRQAIKAIRLLQETQVTLEAVFTRFQQTMTNDEPMVDAPVQEQAMLLHLRTANFVVTLPLMHEELPKDDSNHQCTTRVICEKTNLLCAIEAIAAHNTPINLHIQDAKIIIEELPTIGEIPLALMDGPEMHIKIYASYLLSMLKKLHGSQVILEVNERRDLVLRSHGTEMCVFRLHAMAITPSTTSG